MMNEKFDMNVKVNKVSVTPVISGMEAEVIVQGTDYRSDCSRDFTNTYKVDIRVDEDTEEGLKYFIIMNNPYDTYNNFFRANNFDNKPLHAFIAIKEGLIDKVNYYGNGIRYLDRTFGEKVRERNLENLNKRYSNSEIKYCIYKKRKYSTFVLDGKYDLVFRRLNKGKDINTIKLFDSADEASRYLCRVMNEGENAVNVTDNSDMIDAMDRYNELLNFTVMHFKSYAIGASIKSDVFIGQIEFIGSIVISKEDF